jgi:hypothetical protein
MNDDVSVDCDAMDRVDELANLFHVDLENESLRIAKARAASNGEPVYVTLGDVNAAAAKMAADRAATKPLVDAAIACGKANADAVAAYNPTRWSVPPDTADTLEAALTRLMCEVGKVYEASKDKSEVE